MASGGPSAGPVADINPLRTGQTVRGDRAHHRVGRRPLQGGSGGQTDHRAGGARGDEDRVGTCPDLAQKRQGFGIGPVHRHRTLALLAVFVVETHPLARLGVDERSHGACLLARRPLQHDDLGPEVG